jgi:uncharacterized protein YecE (DUF72 family)
MASLDKGTGATPVHVGTSGWSYKHWKGRFYPEDLPVSRWLEFYINNFHTVEVNNSYYRWPSDAAFTSWQERLPDGFLMTIKAPRPLTHYKRLSEPEEWIGRIDHSLGLLGKKLGVFLVQLSANFASNHERLAYFLERIPRRIRTAVEFRHPSWNTEETFALLEHYGTAYCVTSGAHLPCILRATASFVYVRMHGPDPTFMYRGSYPDADLRWWADRIREWQSMGKEVFVYFNNDGEANAVYNARTLGAML